MTGILSRHFPATQGYIIRPENQVATGFADLNLFHDVEEFDDPLQYFLVQCKRPEYENNQAKWAEGEEQLSRYLRDIHGRTGSTGDRRDVFGAVVVGKKIVFYKYLYGVQEVRRWRPAREGNFYNLQIHYRDIEDALDWIRVRH